MEKKNKFTPGPWSIDEEDGLADGLVAITDGGCNIAHVETWDLEEDAELRETAKANARLIKAAPKMLDALWLIYFAVTSDADGNDGKVDRMAIHEAASAAITEALGE